MKRRHHLKMGALAVLVVVGILLMPGLADSPASAGVNHVLNPGFEEPDGGVNDQPTSWTPSTSSPYRGAYPDVHSGDFSAYLHGASGSYSQVVSVGASTVYRFETFTRANASASETVTLEIRDSLGGVLDSHSWNGTDHGWTLRLAYISTPINAWDALITLSISGDAPAEAWFDDVSLEEKLTTDCFIATAAYGSPVDDGVNTLRSFRDQFLDTNSVGQGFVSLYYRVSPPAARFIDDHPSLKPVVQVALLPALAVSGVATRLGQGGMLCIAGVLAVFLITGFIVWKRRSNASRGAGPQRLAGA